MNHLKADVPFIEPGSSLLNILIRTQNNEVIFWMIHHYPQYFTANEAESSFIQ